MDFLALLHAQADVFSPPLNLAVRERLSALDLPVLFLGLFFLGRILGGTVLNSGLKAFALTAAAVFVCGNELSLMKLGWTALFAAGLAASRTTGSPSARLLACASAAGVAYFGGCLAILSVLLTWLFVGLLEIERKDRFGVWCAAAAAVLALAVMPVYKLPTFPAFAHLAELSPLPDGFPLAGPSHWPNPIRYEAYLAGLKTAGWKMVVFLIVIAVARIFISPQDLKGRRLWTKGAALASLTYVLVMFEIAVPAAYRPWAPFAALVKAVPGLALQPLPWALFPVAASFAGLLCLMPLGWRAAAGLSVFFPALLFLAPPKIEERAFSTQLADRAVHERLENPGQWRQYLLNSPMHYAVRNFGAWVMTPGERESREHLRRLKAGQDFVWSASANASPERAKKAIDGHRSTRWGTGRPQQPGDTFELMFDRPIPVSRLTLSLGESAADFPRGIAVEISADSKSFTRLIDYPHWLGPIRWTRLDVPYFGPQQDVDLDFPRAETVTAIRLIQTGKDDIFDWSIAEIILYGP